MAIGDGGMDTAGTAIRLGAVRIEIQPPARAIARRLRLASGTPAVMITARLDAASPVGSPPQARGEPGDGRWARASVAADGPESDGAEPDSAEPGSARNDGCRTRWRRTRLRRTRWRRTRLRPNDGARNDGTGPETIRPRVSRPDAGVCEPVALTVLALRPDMFRIVLDTAEPGP